MITAQPVGAILYAALTLWGRGACVSFTPARASPSTASFGAALLLVGVRLGVDR